MNFKHVSRKTRNLFILVSFHAAMTQFLTAAAPVAVNDNFSLQEDQPLSVPPPFTALLANDSDPDGDSLTVFSVGSAVNGSLSLVGGNLSFTPYANFVGTASFNYSIHDGHGGTATATAFITYTPVNDPPVNVLVGDLNASEDTTKPLSLRVDDVDAGSATFSLSLTVSNGVLNVSGGMAALSGNGTTNVLLLGTLAQINSTLASNVNYLPPTNFFGSVSFTMFAAELDAQGNPLISDTDQFVVNVSPVNDPPIARHDHFSVEKISPSLCRHPTRLCWPTIPTWMAIRSRSFL